MNKVLEIMDCSNLVEHRLAAGKVIYGLLYSNNKDYALELIHRGLLDIILRYAHNSEEEHKKNHRLIHIYLKIITNLVATTL